jgi:hypothetical protein
MCGEVAEQKRVLESSFSPQVFSDMKQPVEPEEGMDRLNDSFLALISVHLLPEPLWGKNWGDR